MFLVLTITYFACAQQSLEVGEFYNPPGVAFVDGDYSLDLVWTAGDVQTINFTTTYTNYTIAIWQQSLVNDSTFLGPVIFGMSLPIDTQRVLHGG